MVRLHGDGIVSIGGVKVNKGIISIQTFACVPPSIKEKAKLLFMHV